MTWWPKLKRVLIVCFAGIILLCLMANVWVIKSTEDKVLTNIRQFPKRQVALVLGTSSKLKNGSSNPFFENRIKAAAELYHEGKVSHFILSGDNRTRYYNEPMEMKKALIKLHVPDSAITLDLAGLRTLDSIVRSKEIFGQDKITIITQPFHSYRALFISRYYHIDAVVLATQEPGDETPFNVYVREYFARAKAVLDLYVLNTTPKHLGEKAPLHI
ncbi:MAG: SanA protein [Cytophagales bacterium]|jgi:SanA protein|nr:YdcF family protein [Bacteroidota bacterium]MBS1980180.1 YdcF family protein [Bacteroidota bacterium]WHZ08695.1 MAG: SanA protein [Cytophagales bacterium]